MSEMSKVEEVAREIAKANGDEYGSIPLDKSDWKSAHGLFGGTFRDVNEPTQADYDDMARAAIAAMRKPTEAMMMAFHDDEVFHCNSSFEAEWAASIDAALKE